MLIYELVRDSKVNEIAEILYITNFDYPDKKVMLLAEKFRGNLKRIKRRTNRSLLTEYFLGLDTGTWQIIFFR